MYACMFGFSHNLTLLEGTTKNIRNYIPLKFKKKNQICFGWIDPIRQIIIISRFLDTDTKHFTMTSELVPRLRHQMHACLFGKRRSGANERRQSGGSKAGCSKLRLVCVVPCRCSRVYFIASWIVVNPVLVILNLSHSAFFNSDSVVCE